MAGGSLVGQSSSRPPCRVGLPTFDWWRRPASPRPWRGRPVGGGRKVHLRAWDPETQRWLTVTEIQADKCQERCTDTENCVHTWDESDIGDFFGDLFTLKVLLRKNINSDSSGSRITRRLLCKTLY